MSVLHSTTENAYETVATESFVGDRPPKELIEIVAYLAWENRSNVARYQIHGYHEQDWLASEREVGDWWVTLSLDEVELFVAYLKNATLVPRRQDIKVRAYFISKGNSHLQPQKIWQIAESTERSHLFAQAFLDFRDRLSNLRLLSN